MPNLTVMNNNLQELVFEKILSKFSKKAVAVEVLSKLLSTGRDAVYRRLRGDTTLSPEEISSLAKHFNISIDALIFEKVDTVFFNFNTFSQEIKSYQDYLEGIQQKFDKIAQLDKPKLYYASAEIPMFHYCFFPELIGFKLYVWGRTIWDLDFVRDKKFDFDLMPFPAVRMSESLLNAYLNLDSVELWSLNIVDTTLNQIEYTLESGNFEIAKDALVLCDKLTLLTRQMQEMATNAAKFSLDSSPDAASSSFDLFHNEMMYTNNTFFINSTNERMIFSTFTSPNFIFSSDQKICNHVEAWFLRLLTKSNPISSSAEKSRNWFFNGLRQRIMLSKSRIEFQVATMK